MSEHLRMKLEVFTQELVVQKQNKHTERVEIEERVEAAENLIQRCIGGLDAFTHTQKTVWDNEQADLISPADSERLRMKMEIHKAELQKKLREQHAIRADLKDKKEYCLINIQRCIGALEAFEIVKNIVKEMEEEEDDAQGEG